MATMFIDTLPSPSYDKVVESVTSNFTDLVVVGERIELGIKRGKLAQANSNKLPPKKRKGKTNEVIIEPILPQGKRTTPSYLVEFHVGTGSSRHSKVSKARRKKTAQNAKFDPLDLHGTAPSIAEAETRGGTTPQASSCPVSKKLRPQR
ncbi:hypothetical protein CR513_25306, partial [Mucuna pruriens]